MPNIFQRKELVKSMSQAPNIDRLLCGSKFESQQKSHEVKICGKNFVSCSYLLKASLYHFKRINKTFLLKKSFNYGSSNLIYVFICKRCKEKYRKNRLPCEIANKYSQILYKTAAIPTIGSWRTFTFLRRRKVWYLSFFNIVQGYNL